LTGGALDEPERAGRAQRRSFSDDEKRAIVMQTLGAHRWAVICSLIETAKLNNVEPYAWLSDVLTRIADGHPANRLDQLLPWNWALSHRANA
jgi:hypothetical protein